MSEYNYIISDLILSNVEIFYVKFLSDMTAFLLSICRDNIELARQFSTPPPGSRDLHFATRFSQNGWMQFKSCLWKQHLSYWRSPAYNLMRIMHTLVSSLIFGTLFWNQGKKM